MSPVALLPCRATDRDKIARMVDVVVNDAELARVIAVTLRTDEPAVLPVVRVVVTKPGGVADVWWRGRERQRGRCRLLAFLALAVAFAMLVLSVTAVLARDSVGNTREPQTGKQKREGTDQLAPVGRAIRRPGQGVEPVLVRHRFVRLACGR
jgi:hypothetical protein